MKDLANWIASRGIQSHIVVVSHSQPNHSIHGLSKDLQRVTVFQADPVPNSAKQLKEDREGISSFIGGLRPRLVVAQDWLGLGSAYAESTQKAPFLTWAHGSTLYNLQGQNRYFRSGVEIALEFHERRQIEFSQAVISPSKFLVDLYSNTYGYRLPQTRIIPYFFPEQEQEGRGGMSPIQRGGGLNLVFVGLLSKRKGVEEFCEVVLEARSRFPRVTAQIAGASSDYSGFRVSSFLRSRGVNCEFLGLQRPSRLWSKIAPGSVLVVTSRLDNSPNTVYEAGAEGHLALIIGSSNGAAELASFCNYVFTAKDVPNISWSRLLTLKPLDKVFLAQANESFKIAWDRTLGELEASEALSESPWGKNCSSRWNQRKAFDKFFEGFLPDYNTASEGGLDFQDVARQRFPEGSPSTTANLWALSLRILKLLTPERAWLFAKEVSIYINSTRTQGFVWFGGNPFSAPGPRREKRKF